jgi:hypothetical protein
MHLKNDLIDYLINSKLIGDLIADKYGNYGIISFKIVVQKALQVTDGIRFLAIIHEIKGVAKSLRYSNHGRKIYDNLMANYGEYLQGNSKGADRRRSFANYDYALYKK